jgi:TolB protein
MAGGNAGNIQIYVTDDEGKRPRALTSRLGIQGDPSWSPDGETIAFVACGGRPRSSCDEREHEIHTLHVGKGAGGGAVGVEPTRLTFNNVRDTDPYFSPDGTRIAWLAETEPHAFKPGYGIWNIFVMDRDGSGVRNLTDDRQINSVPRWSKDGARIYFHRYEPVTTARWGVYAISLNGTGLTEITNPSLGNAEYPSL